MPFSSATQSRHSSFRGEVRAHCQDRLAAYKVPVQVQFLDEMPLNASVRSSSANYEDRRFRDLAASLPSA